MLETFYTIFGSILSQAIIPVQNRNSSQVQCFIKVSRKTRRVSKVNRGGQLQEFTRSRIWGILGVTNRYQSFCTTKKTLSLRGVTSLEYDQYVWPVLFTQGKLQRGLLLCLKLCHVVIQAALVNYWSFPIQRYTFVTRGQFVFVEAWKMMTVSFTDQLQELFHNGMPANQNVYIRHVWQQFCWCEPLSWQCFTT